MDEVENFFFGQFPNPWALRVSGMGGYTSKCEKSQNHCTLAYHPRYCPRGGWAGFNKIKIIVHEWMAVG